ncbi:rod shape-determining protein MreC [Fundicoccus culcitae]|uniref:Cell shape-determining protein MreC n=1 Tax=Fundicoccus culcitae TaxID=2969821 RepID=A0ABY5P5K6_9LACT|nr:rod shape-determining protein MreC [Fundicoccus culcitae]UUX34031.1 rod shape-determining protein MreC [Fundicoccus culcitae]
MNNKKLIGLLLSGIVIASLVTYTMLNGSSNILTSAVNDTAAWAGRIFSEPVNMVVRFVNSVDDLINTFEENQQLKEKIDQVYNLQVRVADLEAQNESMSQQLQLEESLSDYTVVNATVIGRNPDQWMETLTINVGSNDGVGENMSVMAGNGLIGRIIEVNLTSSKVLLLTSDQSNAGKVAASIQHENGSSNGIVSSYDHRNNHLIMTQVDPEAVISPGDMVITSGLGGVTPSTLFIGEVASAQMDDYGLFQVVRIIPAGEMTDIRFVTVIQKEGQSDIIED